MIPYVVKYYSLSQLKNKIILNKKNIYEKIKKNKEEKSKLFLFFIFQNRGNFCYIN